MRLTLSAVDLEGHAVVQLTMLSITTAKTNTMFRMLAAATTAADAAEVVVVVVVCDFLRATGVVRNSAPLKGK